MNTNECQRKTASALKSARLLALCLGFVFLIAALYGLAPVNYLLSGVLIGSLLFLTLILFWRTRREWLRFLALLIMILGHKGALHLLPSESYPQFFQWLSLAWFTATIPLSIAPSLVFKICASQDPGSQAKF